MSEVINIHAAKTQLSRLVDRAHGGEEIILAKAGKPYARLVPLEPVRPRRLGFFQGQVEVGSDFAAESLRPLTSDELQAWE